MTFLPIVLGSRGKAHISFGKSKFIFAITSGLVDETSTQRTQEEETVALDRGVSVCTAHNQGPSPWGSLDHFGLRVNIWLKPHAHTREHSRNSFWLIPALQRESSPPHWQQKSWFGAALMLSVPARSSWLWNVPPGKAVSSSAWYSYLELTN